jgi:hypothetical protein
MLEQHTTKEVFDETFPDGGAVIIAIMTWQVGAGRALASHGAEDKHPAGSAHSLHGDPLVLQGLVAAAANVTGQQTQAIRDQLAAGQSIAGIAQASGFSAEQVLDGFDQAIDRRMARAVKRGRLPQSVATARAAWYKQSARLQLDQPGLSPPFPGLHEVHGLTIGAASRASGIRRSELRAQLKTCATLEKIVAAAGATPEEVVTEAMEAVDSQLDAAVAAGQITLDQQAEWRLVLEKTVTAMIKTPGLHVAGKECAS